MMDDRQLTAMINIMYGVKRYENVVTHEMVEGMA